MSHTSSTLSADICHNVLVPTTCSPWHNVLMKPDWAGWDVWGDGEGGDGEEGVWTQPYWAQHRYLQTSVHVQVYSDFANLSVLVLESRLKIRQNQRATNSNFIKIFLIHHILKQSVKRLLILNSSYTNHFFDNCTLKQTQASFYKKSILIKDLN